MTLMRALHMLHVRILEFRAYVLDPNNLDDGVIAGSCGGGLRGGPWDVVVEVGRTLLK